MMSARKKLKMVASVESALAGEGARPDARTGEEGGQRVRIAYNLHQFRQYVLLLLMYRRKQITPREIFGQFLRRYDDALGNERTRDSRPFFRIRPAEVFEIVKWPAQ